MPKPDRLFRERPLEEVERLLARVKPVLLFHPEPIVVQGPAKMCVCRKGERKMGKKSTQMIQCDECFEWFHFDCAGVGDDSEAAEADWKCHWCTDGPDRDGYQRWKFNRKVPKKRHVRDTPRYKGFAKSDNPPPSYSAPPTWEGKVAEIKEQARRRAVKNRKLEEAAQEIVDGGGHHVSDTQGANGLEPRRVDDGFVDEMVAAGFLDPDELSDDSGMKRRDQVFEAARFAYIFSFTHSCLSL